MYMYGYMYLRYPLDLHVSGIKIAQKIFILYRYVFQIQYSMKAMLFGFVYVWRLMI